MGSETRFVEVFSGPDCTYCEAAKALLTSKGIGFVELRVDEADNLEEFTSRLPRVRSVPQIFIDGDHVGGYEDLVLMDERGRLEA